MTGTLERRKAAEQRMAALAPLLGLPLNPGEQLQARSPRGVAVDAKAARSKNQRSRAFPLPRQ